MQLEEAQLLFANFKKYLRTGDPDDMTQKRGLRSKPVDIIEFVTSKHYVGNLINLWPGVIDNLDQIWNNPIKKHEIVLTGSIRSGKSTTVQLSAEYLAYLFSLMHDPYAEFGLSPGRPIVLALQSVNQKKAERVLLDPIIADVDASPYFKKYFPRNTDLNSIVEFPSDIQIVAFTSNDTSVMGENLCFAAFTEANAMEIIRNSKKLRYSNKIEYVQAEELYTKAKERIKATFPLAHPLFFGLLFTDSSAENPEDFAHTKIEEAKTNQKILVINKPIWEAKPHEEYPPDEPRFLVEVGDAQHVSKMLGDLPHDEIVALAKTSPYPAWSTAFWKDVTAQYAESLGAINPESCISVPMQLQEYFGNDIESALKNLAGIVTVITGSFIPFKDKILSAQDEYEAFTGGRRLFKFEEISFVELFGRRDALTPIDWGELINYDYFEDCVIDPHVHLNEQMVFVNNLHALNN